MDLPLLQCFFPFEILQSSEASLVFLLFTAYGEPTMTWPYPSLCTFSEWPHTNHVFNHHFCSHKLRGCSIYLASHYRYLFINFSLVPDSWKYILIFFCPNKTSMLLLMLLCKAPYVDWNCTFQVFSHGSSHFNLTETMVMFFNIYNLKSLNTCFRTLWKYYLCSPLLYVSLQFFPGLHFFSHQEVTPYSHLACHSWSLQRWNFLLSL